MSKLQQLLYRATGLKPGNAAVDAAVRKRMKQRRLDDIDTYVAEAVASKDELDALIDLMVVPESWFFRDAEAFAVAAAAAARIRSAGRKVRFLSVPCANGEEPYSLAMRLLDVGLPPGAFTIDAVDVSPECIRRAKRAVYQGNAFRGSDLAFRGKYFARCDNGYELDEEVRRLVDFRCGNLLTLAPPETGSYDMIFCRNLLIYFDDATQSSAIRKLKSLLGKDGMLFCGYAETLAFCSHGFERAPHSQSFALRRKGETKRTVLALPPRLPALARQPRPAKLPPPPPSTQAEEGGQDPVQLLEQANRLANEGAVDEARQACRACLALAPDSAEAHFLLGLLSEQRQEDRDAEECLRRAVYLDPDHYEALCHLALLADRQGNDAAARAYRQRAARVYERRAEGQDR